MNNIMPIRIPLYTTIVWLPEYVASRITSRNHKYIYNKVSGIDIISMGSISPWNQVTVMTKLINTIKGRLYPYKYFNEK